MTTQKSTDDRESRAIAVLAPTGRDAALAADVLRQAGFATYVCPDMGHLCAKIHGGIAAILLAEEALSPVALQALQQALQAQEPWSDIPVVLIASGHTSAVARERVKRVLQVIGNAVIIERPLRIITLVAAVSNAVRARRRQYDVRDVLEERQEREQQARSMARVLQQLMGIVSHDLRNPISAIIISCEALLRRHDLNEKQNRGVTRINRAAHRASTMIYDLLDFTRARLGRVMALSRGPCDAMTFIQDTIDEVATAYPDRRLAFLYQGSHTTGVWDANRLTQVVQNLLTNALCYSPKDTPVTIVLDAQGEASLTFSVHNTGRLIDDAQKLRIFEPLERGLSDEAVHEAADNRSIGLGLYIVKQIVVAHGGHITVASAPDTGNTFTVSLPRAPQD